MANDNGQTNDLQVVQKSDAGSDYLNAIVPAYAMKQAEVINDFRDKLQRFTSRLNTPPQEGIDTTPDGKAFTLLISHVEMTLDEMFFGQWETENFKWAVIGNEVVGSMELIVLHPVTGAKMRRTGAAGIIIQMNAAPSNMTAQEKSAWAANPQNKKSNALDLGFPKLKAECLKNAAQSFGALFGRELNRATKGKADVYKPIQRTKAAAATQATEKLLNNQS